LPFCVPVATIGTVTRKAVICVGIASHPISAAGNSWAFLQWALGFRELGWDVWIVESIASRGCVDANWKPCSFAESANRMHWDATMSRFGMRERSTLLVDGEAANSPEAQRFGREAEVFLNVSGHFKHDALATPRARRVYLDLDPGFTQIWAEAYGSSMNFAGHDAFFTVGTRLGGPDCRAPTCGIQWQPTFPPVVLKWWPFMPQPSFGKFSTVAHWHGYSWVEWQGEWYKGKGEEFAKFVELPNRADACFEIATETSTHTGELQAFQNAGWRLTDSATVCHSFDGYERFIRDSSAECSAAKGGYVVSHGGWFSDRSVCYLASGRPVVLQDTGISALLPAGAGLHPFRTLEEAAACCQRVIANFQAEQRAARKLAETHFASEVVIGKMLERLGL
jgi:hypothetical protein